MRLTLHKIEYGIRKSLFDFMVGICGICASVGIFQGGAFVRTDKKRKNPNSKEKNGTLCERFLRALDAEPDIAFGGSLIEIRGRGALTLNGGGRILDYDDRVIRIALKHGALAIKGRRLVCAAFCAGRVRIEGVIESVSFEEMEKIDKLERKGVAENKK